ncbi:MAG TPA: MFS transporter [Ignavibacteriaceae bacterium]|nr:MFS transporter [Ignavibacteriaceae bacterium]
MYKKNAVFSAACIGMLFFGVSLISIGTLLPSLTTKFQLDDIAAGSLVSLLPIGILLGSLLFGPVVDKYGYKFPLIISSLLVIAGIEGVALSTSFFAIQVSVFFIGFGGGVINGGTNALVADISSEAKGASLSLLGVFYGIGALGMPAVLGYLSRFYSIDSIVSGIGLSLLIAVIYFLVVRFPAPKQPQGLPIKEGIKFIKDPVILLAGFFLFFQSGIEGITNNWTTTFLQNDLGVNSELSLFALTYYVAGLTVARLLLGFMLKKVSPNIVLYLSLLVGLAGSLVLLFSSSYGMAIIGLVILGVAFAAGFPVLLGIIGDIYSGYSGTAFSLIFVIALTGNTIINYVTGLVANAYGIRNFSTIIIMSIVIMVVILQRVLKLSSAKK